MNPQIENAISRIFDQAQSRYSDMITGARQRTGNAAGKITKGKKPVKTLSKMGLKLNAVSHRTADKVLRQQVKAVNSQIDITATRLRNAADARSVRQLVADQVRMIPENAALFAGNARETVSIVAAAGSEVGSILKNTVAEFRGVKSATHARRSNTTKQPAAPRKTAAKTKAAA